MKFIFYIENIGKSGLTGVIKIENSNVPNTKLTNKLMSRFIILHKI